MEAPVMILLLKFRPQRMQQPDKLHMPHPLHGIPLHWILTLLIPNCPYHLAHHLVPQDPPSVSSYL